MKVFSVELKEVNEGMFDNFNGTFEECQEWCKKHGYHNWDKPNGARICDIEVEDGCFTYCYEQHEEWENE